MDSVITNNHQQWFKASRALKQVIDPEIGLNIVDLGLIYQADFDENEKEMFVSMTLTTQYCPMGESIRSGAINALREAFPDYTLHFELVFDPPWSSERISEEGQKYLNQD